MRWLGDGVKLLVLGAVGVTTFGCSDRAIGGEEGNGDDGSGEDGSSEDDGTDEGPSTSPSTSATTSPGTSATSVSTTVDDAGTATDDGPVPTCSEPELFGYYSFCLGEADPGGECICDAECQAMTMSLYTEQDCCGSCSYVFGGTSCAEVIGDTCCFVTYINEEGCGKGRPFVVDGAPRVATIAASADWACDGSIAPRVASLDVEMRARLEVCWLATARAEHASVASFARFTLQLLALGAPPDLLADAQRATLDEVEHARLAYALASAYRGAPLGPGPLDVAAGLAEIGDRDAILRSLLHEGCVAETIAATEAAIAAARAEDPTVRRVLARIADDEARHAALAWRAAKWIVERWPELASVAQAVVNDACARRLAIADDVDDPGCPQHGVLGSRESQQIARECIARTIRPAAAALV